LEKKFNLNIFYERRKMSDQLVDLLNKYGYWIYIAVFVGIFYFTLILPQRRRQKRQRALIESLNVGDKVITIGGIFGTVKRLLEDKVLITVSPKVDIEFTKNSVIRKMTK